MAPFFHLHAGTHPKHPHPGRKDRSMTSKSGDGSGRDHKMATRLTNAGRDPFAHHGYVNTPGYHVSTLLYPSAQDYLVHRGRYQYGRRGTPTSEALEAALTDIEGPQ